MKVQRLFLTCPLNLPFNLQYPNLMGKIKIEKVNVYHVSIPFSGEFSHSRKKGFSAENTVVEVIVDHERIRGYGEGAPRDYVTGESQMSIASDIKKFVKRPTFPWHLETVSQIWAFIDDISYGKEHNAAVCAIETSLLDAFGRHQKKPIIDYFKKKFFTDTIQYGAAIPLSNNSRIDEICRLIKRLKIEQLRVKVGKDFQQNKNAIIKARQIFGDNCELRIDVNGAWDRNLALQHVDLIKDYNISVVEQPMAPRNPDIAALAEALEENHTLLMADESVCCPLDLEHIIQEGHYRMVNVRLSKCGGFRNSLKIIDLLRKNGLHFQVGCQLGESGLLSAAGRALGLLCRDARYYDGSYDAFLLKENLTTVDVLFGQGGKAGPLHGHGLGVSVSEEGLKRLSDGFPAVTISRP
jgi:L-alanine-DL-glutamate epimerase-like enolase superfamily enzyme